MPTLSDRLQRLLNSPKGRNAVRKAKRYANDPKTQRKLRSLRARLRRH